MANEWEIKGRSPLCTATGRAFAEGEPFYTLLYAEKGGFRREDLCEEAWAALCRKTEEEKIQQSQDSKLKASKAAKPTVPFSFWRMKFEPPPPAPPEPLAKQTAETLLRHYMAQPGPEHARVRYILALMLERKRILKPVETREEEGARAHVYLHVKTGEIFLIPDPGLRLEQIAEVQREVAGLLA